ncbi:MAG: RRXRR domain-containing protein [Desulfamplus sp.]|nr:RRXRR domain-containing protein [Desulfamplus sp.]
MLVFVLNKEGKPLMPCQAVKARILLKERKAKVVKRTPYYSPRGDP